MTLRRAARGRRALYHFSPNGRASTSKDQTERFCWVIRQTLSARSSGLTKKSSGSRVSILGQSPSAASYSAMAGVVSACCSSSCTNGSANSAAE